MFFRRALYYWQFTAAILLPVWVVIGRGLFGSPTGWDLALYIVLGIILGFSLLAVAALTVARKQVRDARALTGRDTLVLGIWHGAVILFGFVGAPWVAAIVVVVTIAAFWNAVWTLFTETRTRLRNAFTIPDFAPQPSQVDAGHYDAQAPGQGDIIIVDVEPEPPTTSR